MKKYEAIGELLMDFRKINNMSQAEFATKLSVDTRTVQRWENGITLIKPEKEEDLVNVTLLPYQLIRNLNASKPIPTFYDFSLRKYSLTQLSNTLPQASFIKANIDRATKRIRTNVFEKDIDYIVKHIQFHKTISKSITKVIEESIKLLPEMNLIITDDSGYYSGHSLIFPIKQDTYEKLKNRKMAEDNLTVEDLVNYKLQTKPIFYGFDITADCNDNIFYLLNQLFRFVRDLPTQNYLYCATPFRKDSYELNEKAGLKIIWEEKKRLNEYGLEISPRFQEGNFKEFLFSKKP
jgi:transcriptional regulator with XRE-family HTH domain